MSNRKFTWMLSSLSFLALLLALIQLDRTPLAWFDEVLRASASYSVASGRPAVPSVLGLFPHAGRFDLFYGPLPFWLGGVTIRLFGLSLWSWRFLSWFFGVLIVVAAGRLALALGCSSSYAALAAALVAFSPPLGYRITSGRLDDTLAVGCEIAALYLLFHQGHWSRAVLAGGLLAAAVLSTPRSQPFVLGLALIGVGLGFPKDQLRIRKSLTLALAVAVGIVCGWTFYVGMTPWKWIRYLVKVSSGDPTNVSPALGGEWSGGYFFAHDLILPGFIAIWIIAYVVRAARAEKPNTVPGRLLAAVSIGTVLTLVLTSRVFHYEIFWAVPLIPVIIGVTASYEPEPTLFRSYMASVLIALLCVSFIVRIGKVAQVFFTWRARDPQVLKEFVCENVPPTSTVYGPTDFYFYAVEECGSRYLFAEQWTTPGLSANTDRASYERNAFVLWPADAPRDVQANLVEVSRLQRTMGPMSMSFLGRLFPYRGYPSTVLYRVQGMP